MISPFAESDSRELLHPDRNIVHHVSLLDRIDDLLTLDHLSEYGVFVIQPGGGDVSDEELTAVGVRAGVRHGEYSRPGVTELGMELVPELVARTPGTGPVGAAGLDHEIRYHAVKFQSVVKTVVR